MKNLIFIFCLILAFNSCVMNSTVSIHKHKGDKITTSPSSGEIYNQKQSSIQNKRINVADFFNQNDTNNNSSFFISLINPNTNQYLEARTIRIEQDSILFDVTLKSLTKNKSINFEVNLETKGVQTKLINKQDINDGFILDYTSRDTLKSYSLFKIRKFEASSIEKNILHLYTGEISFANQEYSKFVILNDITATNKILATFSLWLSTEIDIGKIETRCYNQLKKQCLGMLKLEPFKINDGWFYTIVSCTGKCIKD